MVKDPQNNYNCFFQIIPPKSTFLLFFYMSLHSKLVVLYKIWMRPCKKQLLFEPTGPSPSESLILDTEEGIGTVRASIYLFTEKVVLFARLYDDK